MGTTLEALFIPQDNHYICTHQAEISDYEAEQQDWLREESRLHGRALLVRVDPDQFWLRLYEKGSLVRALSFDREWEVAGQEQPWEDALMESADPHEMFKLLQKALGLPAVRG